MYALEKNKSKLSRKFIEKTPDYAKKQLVLCSQFLSNNSKENKQIKVTKATLESILKQVIKQANKKSGIAKHQHTTQNTLTHPFKTYMKTKIS